jgi:hypothetical protein
MNWNIQFIKNVASDSFGIPGYKPKQQTRKPLPDMSPVVVVYRALRRLCQIRLQCFQRIWHDVDEAQRNTLGFGIRVFQTFIVLEVTLDLFLICVACFLYYLLCFNRISKWCSFLIIPLICGLYLRGNWLPLYLYLGLICYVIWIWLTCVSFWWYRSWINYNLSYVSVTKLTSDLPGKHAWRFYVATMLYLMMTSVEDLIRNVRALKLAQNLLRDLDISVYERITYIDHLTASTATYHDLLEEFLIDCVTNVIHLIQVILTAFF